MPPVPHHLHRQPTHETTILLLPGTRDGADSRGSPTTPPTLIQVPDENVPGPQITTTTVSVFFTVTEVRAVTITAQVTTTESVATTTIFSRPTGSTRWAIVRPTSRDSFASSSPAFTTSLSSSSITSTTSPSPSSTASTTFPSPSSTASTISTLERFPPFPSGPTLVSPALDSTGSKLSSGGIAGITLSCVLFVILLVTCFIRLRLMRKREKDRPWVTPFIEEKPVVRASVKQRQDKRMEAFAERWERLRRRSRRPDGQGNARGEALVTTGPGGGDRDRPTARPQRHHGHNRTGRPPVPPVPLEHIPRRRLPSPPPVYREPSARRPVRDDVIVSSLFPHGAVAKLHFEPIRADELEVCPGDYLRVVALYDDGWAQCKTVTGQKGMVPTACLRVNDVRRLAH